MKYMYTQNTAQKPWCSMDSILLSRLNFTLSNEIPVVLRCFFVFFMHSNMVQNLVNVLTY